MYEVQYRTIILVYYVINVLKRWKPFISWGGCAGSRNINNTWG